jgi:chromosomal replication initiator protein
MIFRPETITPMDRARVKARLLGIRLGDWFGDNRHRSVAWPRQDFWRELRLTTDLTLPQIGRLFDRDHTTIIHGIRASERRATQ